MFKEQDRSYMMLAIAQAKKAYISNEVPIGAVIVLDNKVIGVGRNKVIEVNDVSSHAEMNAIENDLNLSSGKKKCRKY